MVNDLDIKSDLYRATFNKKILDEKYLDNDFPVVSIITPAYNAEQFISQTIECVLNQTYDLWELLIVDDCSTDKTKEIIKKFTKKDCRIKLISHDINSGVAAARNTALSLAKGRFIAFLDSDDLWAPDKVAKQVQFMLKNNYALTYTDYLIFNEKIEDGNMVIHAKSKMSYKQILKDTSIGCLTVMVDKKYVGEFKMPLINHMEDNCTWYSILKKGFDGYGMNECLSFYRSGNNSLTSNKLYAAKKQWNVYREFFGFSRVRTLYYFSFYAFNAVKRRF